MANSLRIANLKRIAPGEARSHWVAILYHEPELDDTPQSEKKSEKSKAGGASHRLGNCEDLP
jgi:hypothetical protein